MTGSGEPRSLRNLARTLRVLAVVPILAGGWTAVLGGQSIPDTGPLAANAESELRFYAVWWIGAGVFLFFLGGRLTEGARELRVFCALLFLAGLSRIPAIVAFGWPSRPQVALLAIELTLPIVLVVWHARAARAPATTYQRTEA